MDSEHLVSCGGSIRIHSLFVATRLTILRSQLDVFSHTYHRLISIARRWFACPFWQIASRRFPTRKSVDADRFWSDLPVKSSLSFCKKCKSMVRRFVALVWLWIAERRKKGRLRARSGYVCRELPRTRTQVGPFLIHTFLVWKNTRLRSQNTLAQRHTLTWLLNAID
jgi:hypothetical protein